MKWLQETKIPGSALLAGAILVLAGTSIQGVLAAPAEADKVDDSGDYPRVTDQRLLNGEKDNGWLMYRRSYSARGFAPFTRINKKNVKNLEVAFDYKTGLKQGHEAPPIVNGNYMFITTPLNHVVALDATSGKVLWTYQQHLAKGATNAVCCGVVNRGVALYRDNVYMATLDSHVVALDAMTGKVKWDKILAKAGRGYSMTVAPLVVKGKIVVGSSGGEYGARGFIEALDAKTGDKVWKIYTVPTPDKPAGDTWPKGAYKTGGGPAWQTGSYDPATDTLLWGVGNPSPWLATLRPGANLYTNSVLALDPANGEIKWHYQFTPHGTWDYDGNNAYILSNIKYQGKSYKAIVHADRNGWFYAIDRTNGKFIYAKSFVKYNQSITGFKNGVAQTDESKRPAQGKKIFTCPSSLGASNWWPASVDPQTHMAYVPTLHACMTLKGFQVNYNAGLPFMGETLNIKPTPDNRPYGSVQAIDLNTGKQVWQYQTAAPWDGGMLSTAGGLLFSGSAEGYFYAFDTVTGKVLWKSKKLSSGIIGVPTTYKIDGRQYVAVYAGWGGATPLGFPNNKQLNNIKRGGHLYVFSLK